MCLGESYSLWPEASLSALRGTVSLVKEPNVPSKELSLGLMMPSSWVCEACLNRQ